VAGGEQSWRFLGKLHADPAVPSVSPREASTHIHLQLVQEHHRSVIHCHDSPKWKLRRCLSANGWSSKMQSVHVIGYSALKGNEIVMHARTWVNLETIRLSKISQTQKVVCCMLSFT